LLFIVVIFNVAKLKLIFDIKMYEHHFINQIGYVKDCEKPKPPTINISKIGYNFAILNITTMNNKAYEYFMKHLNNNDDNIIKNKRILEIEIECFQTNNNENKQNLTTDFTSLSLICKNNNDNIHFTKVISIDSHEMKQNYECCMNQLHYNLPCIIRTRTKTLNGWSDYTMPLYFHLKEPILIFDEINHGDGINIQNQHKNFCQFKSPINNQFFNSIAVVNYLISNQECNIFEWQFSIEFNSNNQNDKLNESKENASNVLIPNNNTKSNVQINQTNEK